MNILFRFVMAAAPALTRASLSMGARARRVVGGGPRDVPPGPRGSARSDRTAFAARPPSFRSRERPPTTATAAWAPLLGGPAGFHSSTALLMARRKRNGGRAKKGKPHARRTNGRDEAENGAASTSSTDLGDASDDGEERGESAPAFTAAFASEYHAPVMPRECVDALLQQGEWGEMLRARKERWRKKRSIAEAKRRRLALLQHDDDEEGDGDRRSDAEGGGEEGADPSPATSAPDEIEGRRPRLFVDGTLGGGGHAQALLEQLGAGDVLIGCDVDLEALSTASARLREYLATRDYLLDGDDGGRPECGWEEGRPLFVPVRSNFRDLVAVLSKVRHPVTGRPLLGDRGGRTDGASEVEFPRGASGVLLDLGVSSRQIDAPERGFAFMQEGPLDMRMSGGDAGGPVGAGLTAADVCNEFDEDALADVLRAYGDESRARRIAGAIVQSRPLHTTTDLVHAINSVTPTFARSRRAGLIATSARVFQALRIVVNEEDGALREVLEGVAPWVLARGGGHPSSRGRDDGEGAEGAAEDGILVVLSYHSMEDKMAKRVMRDGQADLFGGGSRRRGGGALDRDLFGNVIDGGADWSVPFEPLAKPRKATEEEVAANSRSRSATMRVAVRI